MLNESERRLLKSKIKRMLRESIFEAQSDNGQDDDDKRKHSQSSSNREQSVLKWLRSDQIDHAAICRELWPKMNEDTARSLFSKKVRGEDADGNPYSFTEKEINSLYNMKDRFISKIQ